MNEAHGRSTSDVQVKGQEDSRHSILESGRQQSQMTARAKGRRSRRPVGGDCCEPDGIRTGSARTSFTSNSDGRRDGAVATALSNSV